MNKNQIKRLKSHGWKIGSARDFLKLSREEAEFVEIKLALSQYFKLKRTKQHLTQIEVAKRIKSSQSRVAKMEKGDPSVSTDLLIRSLFAIGSSKKELAHAINPQHSYSP